MIVSGLWNKMVVVTRTVTATTPVALVIVGRTALAITGMSVAMVGTTITTTPRTAMTEGMSAVMEEAMGVKDRIKMIATVKLNQKRTALRSLFQRKSLVLPAVEDTNQFPHGGPLVLGLVQSQLALGRTLCKYTCFFPFYLGS